MQTHPFKAFHSGSLFKKLDCAGILENAKTAKFVGSLEATVRDRAGLELISQQRNGTWGNEF